MSYGVFVGFTEQKGGYGYFGGCAGFGEVNGCYEQANQKKG
jgi:hypothetical protein